MTYNLTFIQNTSGMVAPLQGINEESNGLFGTALLIFIFFILFSRLSGSTQDRWLGASFITSLLVGIAFGLGIVNAWHLTFPITMLVIGIIMKVWGET